MVKWDQQESKLTNSMQVKHSKPTDKKCKGWDRDSNQWPVLSGWVIGSFQSYWIGSSRRLKLAGAEVYTEKEQRGYKLCEKKLWRYWSGKYVLTWMNRHAQTSDCYLLLHIFVLPFTTAVQADFNPNNGTFNEQRNEWLKSSTVENRLKRERDRERWVPL